MFLWQQTNPWNPISFAVFPWEASFLKESLGLLVDLDKVLQTRYNNSCSCGSEIVNDNESKGANCFGKI